MQKHTLQNCFETENTMEDMTKFTDEELTELEDAATTRLAKAQATGAYDVDALRVAMAAIRELARRVLEQPKDTRPTDDWAKALAADLVTAGEIETILVGHRRKQ